MSVEHTASQAVEAILSSDKTGWVVAGGSFATGIGTSLMDLQPLLSFGATAMGIVLSTALTTKHVLQTYWEWKDRQNGYGRDDQSMGRNDEK